MFIPPHETTQSGQIRILLSKMPNFCRGEVIDVGGLVIEIKKVKRGWPAVYRPLIGATGDDTGNKGENYLC
jgi:hypothetical protein